jgi:hypothetical protein
MIFAVNKLIPGLVPIATTSILRWLEYLGLDSTTSLTNEDAENKPWVKMLRHRMSWVLFSSHYSSCYPTLGLNPMLVILTDGIAEYVVASWPQPQYSQDYHNIIGLLAT